MVLQEIIIKNYYTRFELFYYFQCNAKRYRIIEREILPDTKPLSMIMKDIKHFKNEKEALQYIDERGEEHGRENE